MKGNGGRERLAWAILLVSFSVWLALLVAIPIGISSLIQDWSRPLLLSVQANGGTVGLTNGNGARDALFAGEPPRAVEGPASILTNTTDTALVNVYTPDQAQVLSRLMIYGNTNVDVQSRAPRFELSNHDYELALNLQNGRLRLHLPAREGRPLRVQVATPQEGAVVLEQAGQYSIEATNASTNVMVQEGQARVEAAGHSLPLSANQRALILLQGKPEGPLGSERELVRNGGFSDGLGGWTPLAWDIELGDQSEGTTSVIEADGEQVLRLHRVGLGHAAGVVFQEINQDVMDFTSLELFVTLRVTQQSLGVCGQAGSECPLFVRVVYEDVYGSERVWQQGFFAVGNVVDGVTPGICQTCAPPINPHQRVFLGQLYSYESGNLLEKLAQQNIPPRVIESVSLEASGHTFETHVFYVSLIAEE